MICVGFRGQVLDADREDLASIPIGRRDWIFFLLSRQWSYSGLYIPLFISSL